MRKRTWLNLELRWGNHWDFFFPSCVCVWRREPATAKKQTHTSGVPENKRLVQFPACLVEGCISNLWLLRQIRHFWTLCFAMHFSNPGYPAAHIYLWFIIFTLGSIFWVEDHFNLKIYHSGRILRLLFNGIAFFSLKSWFLINFDEFVKRKKTRGSFETQVFPCSFSFSTSYSFFWGIKSNLVSSSFGSIGSLVLIMTVSLLVNWQVLGGISSKLYLLKNYHRPTGFKSCLLKSSQHSVLHEGGGCIIKIHFKELNSWALSSVKQFT